MKEHIKQGATRIKALREIEGESVESLAAALSISQEEYRRFESADADISASVLFEIAHHRIRFRIA